MERGYWILKDNIPVKTKSVKEWGEFFEDLNNRRVALTEIPPFEVSTVFLGIDYNFDSNGPPLLFESMVFSDDGDGDLDVLRYSTWDEAVSGHNELVKKYEAKVEKFSKTLEAVLTKSSS